MGAAVSDVNSAWRGTNHAGSLGTRRVSSLTFFKPIPEGARAAHGPALVIQGHGAIPEAAVRVRVILPIGIGEAVRPQHGRVGQAHLGDSSGTRWNKRMESKRWKFMSLFKSWMVTKRRLLIIRPYPSLPTSLPCLFSSHISM